MSKTSGTLLEKMKDRRFRKTEEAIFEVFAENSVALDINTVIKGAKVSSSTFYRHHQSVNCLLSDYERLIIERYKKYMAEILKGRKDEFELIVYWTLIFIGKNKDKISVVAERGNFAVIYRMVGLYKNEVIDKSRLTRNVDKLFEIYAFEVCGLIRNWQETDFAREGFVSVKNDILYLTYTIRDRLGALSG